MWASLSKAVIPLCDKKAIQSNILIMSKHASVDRWLNKTCGMSRECSTKTEGSAMFYHDPRYNQKKNNSCNLN